MSITRSFANLITATGTSGVADGSIVNADIDSAAGIVFTKLASTGTITLDNIQFPATAVPSANANNLDDYEEGTWSVDVKGGTTAGTRTLLTSNATYTKIGRQVTCNFFVRWESGTGTGDLIITGLPFTSRNESGFYYGGSIGSFDRIDFTAGSIPCLFLAHNSTQIAVNQVPDNNPTIAIPYDAGDAAIVGNITYFV